MTEDVAYLTVEDVLLFHAAALGSTQRGARAELNRPDDLASALGRAEQRAYYAGADIAETAACVGHSIAQCQAFTDGNKRTAYLSLKGFLRINHYRLDCSQDDLAKWIELCAAGLTIEQFGQLLRPHIKDDF